MPAPIINNPILNSPFAEPGHHWVLDDNGVPTGEIATGRRRSEFIVPVPPATHQVNAQAALDLDDAYGKREPNDYINEIRTRVGAWRALGEAGVRDTVSPVTARLLRQWRDKTREKRLFFCQIEAVGTAIWLAEVAPRREIERLRAENAKANPELLRIAFKLATGAGKTAVMAMLIAWQTLNAVRTGKPGFSDRFLIVAPGLTVKDRLRVLQPADPANTYVQHDIVPRDMRDDLHHARVVITNFHAFQRREASEASPLAKKVIGGRKGPKSTLQTEGQMIRHICEPLLGPGRIMVLNDEAHHCYREKVGAAAPKLDAEGKAEAKNNNAAARLWISGIEALQRVTKRKVQVYDLSATPFFLRGSGESEGKLFPWVVSDFSLIDAIEAGIVKVPRVPIHDVSGADEPMYRNIYKYIKEHGTVQLPKEGRSKHKEKLYADQLPSQLTGGLTALHGYYAKLFTEWQGKGSPTPPVFIVVCNNTATSKLVYDWIAGYERPEKMPDGSTLNVLIPGQFPLLSNVEDGGPGQRRFAARPRTILIDSAELETGEALSDSFRALAAPEIEAFKRELRTRGRHDDADKLTDADLLREVMNTVGQEGRLGEQIRCVVSVSMLTEGWDARTVQCVLGVRAFGTQLLCEQVIGRALRRVSYDPIGVNENGDPMFKAEYAEILGIPFSFVPANSAPDYTPAKKPTRVKAVLPEREALEIRFPRVLGYRTVLPPGRVSARFTEESRFTIGPEYAAADAVNAAIVGPQVNLSLDDLRHYRDPSIAFHLAGHTLRHWFRDQDDNLKPWLFPSLLAITRRWMAECLSRTGGTSNAYLLWHAVGNRAAEKIYLACVESAAGAGTLRPILDPYNESGSTKYVGFNTTKTNFWTARADRCQINLIVCDGNWEAACAQDLEAMPEVLRYAKNDRLGFEVPYIYADREHPYRPDFIAVVDDGAGPDDPLHLVLEVKGEKDEQDDAKHDTIRRLWVPAVNAAGRFGRWDFVLIEDQFETANAIRERLAARAATESRAA
jgi:type III restriction enzyme